ncbi:golgi reassembly stacking protein [Pelomyxa schiedti]|nr:golgi reassembly stacking protein [Pelomyxa schiedti]
MGQGESQEEADPTTGTEGGGGVTHEKLPDKASANYDKVGFHVLHVYESSPGEMAGLKPVFDYIIAANNNLLIYDSNQLTEVLSANIGQVVVLLVYNLLHDAVREVRIVPSREWGGPGVAGITVRVANFSKAHELVWHVIGTFPHSPAAEAGLEGPYDYIVGSPDAVFNDSEDFFAFILANQGKSVQFYVYNALKDSVRTVSITPRKWGGSGILGCDIGVGLLHQLPTPNKPKQTAPEEQEFQLPHSPVSLQQQLDALDLYQPEDAPAATPTPSPLSMDSPTPAVTLPPPILPLPPVTSFSTQPSPLQRLPLPPPILSNIPNHETTPEESSSDTSAENSQSEPELTELPHLPIPAQEEKPPEQPQDPEQLAHLETLKESGLLE